jgi:hypothetical protein
MGGRGTFSPTTSTLLVGRSESVLPRTPTRTTTWAWHPTTVVAGHKKPEASDQDVAAMLDGTRSYIARGSRAIGAD